MDTAIVIKDLTKRLISQLGTEQQNATDIVARLSDMERIRLWSGLRFIENRYDVLTFIFFLEALTSAMPGSKSEKLQQLFVKNSSEQEKKDLVDGYLFSDPYSFGEGSGITRHVLFSDFNADVNWIESNLDTSWTEWQRCCSAGNSSICFCLKWLEENLSNLDLYVARVVEKLYEMRCAVVHEAFPVVFLPEYKDFDNAGMVGTSTIVDAFPLRNGLFISYECSLHPNRIQEIMTAIARQFLINTYLGTSL